ncbi:MAG: hypothetical protein M3Z84_08770 [Actinomycetota bacterium]|nr:hypothetical protein [Actinomycetota bacterium]
MTSAQTVFVVALTIVAAGIVGFALYLFSSMMWGDRWYPPRRKRRG